VYAAAVTVVVAGRNPLTAPLRALFIGFCSPTKFPISLGQKGYKNVASVRYFPENAQLLTVRSLCPRRVPRTANMVQAVRLIAVC